MALLGVGIVTPRKLLKKFIIPSISFLPSIGFAATIEPVTTLVNNISKFILMPLVYGMFGIATLVFVWGVRGFIGSADDAEARGKGAQQMLWGILGMTVMIGAVVLKNIIEGTVKIL